MANKAQGSSRESKKQKGETFKKKAKTQYQIDRDAAKSQKRRKSGRPAF